MKDQQFDYEELREYVDAFKTSSDRARYALYFVVIATILIGISNNNIQNSSWPLRRLDTWYKMAKPNLQNQTANTPVIPGTGRPPASLESNIPKTIARGNPERLRIAREEYHRQFISHAILTSSPIPGVWIDANDLGLVGGIALLLLMSVLFFCVAREHENLYLALYRVRSLCELDGYMSGSSPANLLYHALAMRQVLSFPPTLARWRSRGVLGHFGFVFLLPVLVYSWLIWTNFKTREVGSSYGVNMTGLLSFQCIIAAFLLVLGSSTWSLSRAMARRWRRAFFRVNPYREHAPQMTFREWLRLLPKEQERDLVRDRLVAKLVDTLSFTDSYAQQTIAIEPQAVTLQTATLGAAGINIKNRNRMVKLLLEVGTKTAKEWCGRGHGEFEDLVGFRPDQNQLIDGRWTVHGTWTFRYKTLQAPTVAGHSSTPNESGRAERLTPTL